MIEPFRLYFIRGAISNRGMKPDLIVSEFDVAGDVLSCVFAGGVLSAIDALIFQGSVE